MTDFLAALLAFPTVLFTIPLGVVVGYWLTVMIGAAGIDLLGGGGLDAVEGGVKGAVEGAGHGHGEGHGSFLDVLGFGGVPTTVSVSFVVFLSWLLSLAVGRPLQAMFGALPGALVTGGIATLCLLVGGALAGCAVRPLRPMFAVQQAPRRAELMGRVCVVASGRVDGRFGHATFEDGGAGFILNVVCDKDNALKRGERALILAYDATRDAYEVEPVDWLLPQELEHLTDPRTAAMLAREKSRSR